MIQGHSYFHYLHREDDMKIQHFSVSGLCFVVLAITESCTLDYCGDKAYMQNGRCKCIAGYHLDAESDVCIANTKNEHCGVKNLDCSIFKDNMEGVSNSNCQKNNADQYDCNVECLRGYSLTSDKHGCIPNNSVEKCGCEEEEGTTTCTPINCTEIEGIAYIDSIPQVICAEPNYQKQKDDYTKYKCNVLCDIDHEPNDDKTKCKISDNVSNCGRKHIDCEKIPYSKDGKCIYNNLIDDYECSIEKCSNGGYYNDKTCEPNSGSHCGDEGPCENNDYKFCKEDTGSCVKKCESIEGTYDEDTENGVCYNKNNSLNHCGDDNISCLELWGNNGIDGVACDEGKCKITSCQYGYHLAKDEDICKQSAVDGQCCIKDTNTCCGDKCTQCPLNRNCINGECKVIQVQVSGVSQQANFEIEYPGAQQIDDKYAGEIHQQQIPDKLP